MADEIEKKLTSIETKLDLLRQDYMKIFFALLGIVAASVGLKLVGSPTTTIIFTYSTLFVGVFMLASTIYYRRNIHWLNLLIRMVLCVFILFSSICRGFLFESGRALAPMWYSPTVDTFFIVICFLLIVRAWSYKHIKGGQVRSAGEEVG